MSLLSRFLHTRGWMSVGGSAAAEGARQIADPTRRDFLLKKLPVGSVGAEIGVLRGDFSARILEVVKPRMLHLIDPWKCESGGAEAKSRYGTATGMTQAGMDEMHASVAARFAGPIGAGQVVVHRAASVAAAGQIGDGSLDWVYIDGNHLYEFVKADLEAYWPKVKRGGFVTGDDYGLRGWWEDGVTQAVDEFCQANGGKCQTVFIRRGQFMLRVM